MSQHLRKLRRGASRLNQEVRTTLAAMGLAPAYRKVFAIGENKTATTSIHALFESFGLASLHDRSWVPAGATRVHRQWQAFSDGPPEDFRRLDRLYPRAKFILNTRELAEWLDSRIEHIRHEETQGIVSGNPLWRATHENVAVWIQRWHDHHVAVLDHFAGRPEDLLVVNFIRDPEAAATISRFLGYPPPAAKPYVRPIRKTREQGQLKNPDMIQAAFDDVGVPEDERMLDIYCPSLLTVPSTYPPDTGSPGEPAGPAAATTPIA